MRHISKCAALCGVLGLATMGCSAPTGGGTAGTTGTSGTTGSAGAAGLAGSTGGGATGTAGTGGSVGCTITATSSVSPMIATVGIVTWSTTLSGVQSAKIDFGLTTSYGMTAPVDLTQPSYRTLLLGMKAQRMYNYKIIYNHPTSGYYCNSIAGKRNL